MPIKQTKIIPLSLELWLEFGEPVSHSKIKRSPRIGIDYAGPVWSKKKYRFVLN